MVMTLNISKRTMVNCSGSVRDW